MSRAVPPAPDRQIERIATGALIPYAKNSRVHDEAQVGQIAASIREFGFTNPVLVDDANGIVAGHGRVLAAIKLGLEEVPCIRLSGLTDIQRQAYVIADNKLALNAGWDDEMLRLEVAELAEADFDLGLLGFGEGEITNLLLERQNGETDAEGEWQGMPEFDQQDKSAFRQLIVSFATPADVDRFAERLGQNFGPKVRSIWFPAAEIGRYADKRYESGG